MSEFARVYHPTLSGSFHDVKSSDVESWSKAGWLKTKPKDFDDSAVLPVGESFIAEFVPEIDVVSAPESAAKSDAK